MRILILGGDGYLGWPTAMYLSNKGHDVAVVDNFNKRKWEMECSIRPLIPIYTLKERVKTWKEVSGKTIYKFIGDLTEMRFVNKVLDRFLPEAIIHYGEQPSAPFSMRGNESANVTQMNNIIGTMNVLFAMRKYCPDCHLIKLGTMGEYGTPNIDIEEGYLDIEHNGRHDTFLYPKTPGSFYHLSKVHDTNNIYFACRNWGLRATDLNQGVVYGIDTDETKLHPKLNTSFHYDEIFGTVLNRYCVQAVVGHPLTVYGRGKQTRGFLNILDTLKCVEIAAHNPADHGKFEIYNQFTEVFSVEKLAKRVQFTYMRMHDESTLITYVDNPRNEMEEHYYNPKHTKLTDLGLDPILLTNDIIAKTIKTVEKHKDNVDMDSITMNVKWRMS